MPEFVEIITTASSEDEARSLAEGLVAAARRVRAD